MGHPTGECRRLQAFCMHAAATVTSPWPAGPFRTQGTPQGHTEGPLRKCGQDCNMAPPESWLKIKLPGPTQPPEADSPVGAGVGDQSSGGSCAFQTLRSTNKWLLKGLLWG